MVLNGIDRIDEYAHLFKDKRLGLITNTTGVNNNLVSTIDIINDNFNLVALLSPEHGVRGDMEAGEMVDTYIDPYTNIPVYSMYREDGKNIPKEVLDKIDAVVYDIQDIGARFFTYISSLYNIMEDCGRENKEIIILDRFNVLGGKVEGNILKKDYTSFVGIYPLAIRYGMTVGEFGNLVNEEEKFNCKISIVPVKNWTRDKMYSDTKNFWVLPSPGIPTFETALVYPGTCLFEGTNLSEGRGTYAPFRTIGAPYIDAKEYADRMNEKGLKGVKFSPIYFKPTTSKHKDQQCGGVYLHLVDYNIYEPVKVGIELLYEIKKMYPKEFEFLAPYKEGGRRFIELLSGDNILLRDLDKDEVLEIFEKEAKEFKEFSSKYYIYK